MRGQRSSELSPIQASRARACRPAPKRRGVGSACLLLAPQALYAVRYGGAALLRQARCCTRQFVMFRRRRFRYAAHGLLPAARPERAGPSSRQHV